MFTESRAAIETGYWPLFRFDPQRKELGENPFQLDSQKMHGELQVRFCQPRLPLEGDQAALLSSLLTMMMQGGAGFDRSFSTTRLASSAPRCSRPSSAWSYTRS